MEEINTRLNGADTHWTNALGNPKKTYYNAEEC